MSKQKPRAAVKEIERHLIASPDDLQGKHPDLADKIRNVLLEHFTDTELRLMLAVEIHREPSAQDKGKATSESPLKKRTVNTLEKYLVEAIASVIMKMGLKRLPLLPSHGVMQKMARAAIAVYEEAAAD